MARSQSSITLAGSEEAPEKPILTPERSTRFFSAVCTMRSKTVGTPGTKVGGVTRMAFMIRSILGAGRSTSSEPMSMVSVRENVRP